MSDLYVISTYYQSDELVGQAHALTAMVSINMFLQFVHVIVSYGKKS